MTEEQLRKNYIKLRAENENFMSFMEYKKLYQAPLVCEEVKDKHYKKKVEPIELIEALDLNFNLGNVVKYVSIFHILYIKFAQFTTIPIRHTSTGA